MVCYMAKADTFTKYFSPLELKKPRLTFMEKKKSPIQNPRKAKDSGKTSRKRVEGGSQT